MTTPNGWTSVPLGEICDISIGRTPSRARGDYWGPGAPWLAISDMNQGRSIVSTKETITSKAVRECNCKQVAVGTVLFSFKLSIGKVSVAAVPLYTNEAIAAFEIRDVNQLTPGFLYWALKGLDVAKSVNKAAKGETLNKRKLEELPIGFPNISEQRRLADLLDRAESLRGQQLLALERLESFVGALQVRALNGLL
jgi:type I restriction enzyme S subunit